MSGDGSPLRAVYMTDHQRNSQTMRTPKRTHESSQGPLRRDTLMPGTHGRMDIDTRLQMRLVAGISTHYSAAFFQNNRGDM